MRNSVLIVGAGKGLSSSLARLFHYRGYRVGLVARNINKISTGRKLPLWIVGTCSFGYFDDPLSESFAEELIRADMNAAASVIATSRPITVVGNERYTLDIFESIFNERAVNDDGIGIILQSIKDGSNEGQYFINRNIK